MKTAIALLMASIALAACEDPIEPIPLDGARRDGGRIRDGGPRDGGMREDGGMIADAGPRDASMRDAFVPSFDTGPEPDVFVPAFDGGPDTRLDFCTAIRGGEPCGPGDSCALGTTCLDNGCGERRCLPSGHLCRSAEDCPAGSTCDEGVGVCHRDSGCADSRDCPAGFACESGACVDRRIRCAFEGDCPFGFVCDASSEYAVPFCIRAYTRCASDGACPFFGECLDVLLDGSGSICFWAPGAPSCRNNDDCPVVGEVCGVHPVDYDSRCRPYGPCSNSDECAAGTECLDLWGDGVRECAEVGDCDSTAECSVPGICGVPLAGGPTQCIRRPF